MRQSAIEMAVHTFETEEDGGFYDLGFGEKISMLDLDDMELKAEAEGKSKKAAEQLAAQKIYEMISQLKQAGSDHD